MNFKLIIYYMLCYTLWWRLTELRRHCLTAVLVLLCLKYILEHVLSTTSNGSKVEVVLEYFLLEYWSVCTGQRVKAGANICTVTPSPPPLTVSLSVSSAANLSPRPANSSRLWPPVWVRTHRWWRWRWCWRRPRWTGTGGRFYRRRCHRSAAAWTGSRTSSPSSRRVSRCSRWCDGTSGLLTGFTGSSGSVLVSPGTGPTGSRKQPRFKKPAKHRNAHPGRGFHNKISKHKAQLLFLTVPVTWSHRYN